MTISLLRARGEYFHLVEADGREWPNYWNG